MKQLQRDMGSEVYRNWRNYVITRDDNICQGLNCDSKENLEVHHIYPYSKYKHLRFNKYNGITLCCDCHRKTFGKELYFSKGFAAKAVRNEELFRRKNGGK